MLRKEEFFMLREKSSNRRSNINASSVKDFLP
jgi:hypothetical protein